MENISEILSLFGLPVSGYHCEPIYSGHINSTFKVYSGGSAYILQKINTDIFKYPEQVMHNISAAQKLLKAGFEKSGQGDRRFLEYLEADGRNYCEHNGCWRIYRYMESIETVPDKNSVKAFGKLLGEFHLYTENADISELYVTVPDFHNIEKNLSAVLSLDRISASQSGLYSDILAFYKASEKTFSPMRLTHNDVKWANVIISPETALPDTLIDFDTVMPGYAAFDFGDAVRSVCTTESGRLDLQLLRCFADGYFSRYRNISADEAAAGILSVAAELSARYLYDAVSGKNYFRGLSGKEKMLKHQVNFRLAEFILNNFSSIKKEISKIYAACG